jgi:hypothetical protein
MLGRSPPVSDLSHVWGPSVCFEPRKILDTSSRIEDIVSYFPNGRLSYSWTGSTSVLLAESKRSREKKIQTRHRA